MANYSLVELVDIHLMYGKADGILSGRLFPQAFLEKRFTCEARSIANCKKQEEIDWTVANSRTPRSTKTLEIEKKVLQSCFGCSDL